MNDHVTAAAFADSWNNLPSGSVYTYEQVCEWFEPLTPVNFQQAKVLEMGCGNASLLVHVANWQPLELVGIDLGDSVLSARSNMQSSALGVNWRIDQADLVKYESDGFEVVYSIGVLHHLKDPFLGFMSVLRNVSPGGRFHCWVYGKEGNAVVIHLVEPIRRIACRLPWWFTKYALATVLAVPFFIYSLLFRIIRDTRLADALPLGKYMSWISHRGFLFHRHVAFDQLVTPQTTYISKDTIESWLQSDARIEQPYIIQRNGNSWKFGGVIAERLAT